jgi:hypothetical protein
MATTAFGDKAGAKKSGGEQSDAASVGNGGLKREGDGAQTTAEAPNTERALSTPLAPGFAGAWDRKDIRLPRINLIHKTSKGELIEKFGIGSFALNQEVKLSDGKRPIVCTALRAAKDYQQKLPFGSDEEPKVFNTPEEVEKARWNPPIQQACSRREELLRPARAHPVLIFGLPEGAQRGRCRVVPV